MADASPPSDAVPPSRGAPALERNRLLDWARFRAAGASDSAADPEAAVIGAGAMGRVLLALDERMGRVVAIKEMHPGDPGTPRPQGRFLREARVTGALEHPGIVPVHEIGQRSDGAAYYTMRLVRGRSLAAAIDGADDLRARLALLPHVVDLCHAIAFAHSQGVIHRDLKPENVMVGEFGETVVLDWGLARGLAADPVPGAAPSRASLAGATSPSRTAGVMGTPAFMSPEQAWGRPGEVDEASDVWALGAVLYNLLTGTLPIPGTSVQANLDWLRDDRQQVQPVRERCVEAPPELASVAMACLERDKERRMASAQRMARDLERWQAGERVVAHRYSAWELAAHIVNRNRPLSVAVAVAAAVALAAVGFSITTYQARQEAESLVRQHAFEQLLLAREALESQRPLQAQARLRASLERLDTPLGRALWARIQATPLLMRSKLATEVTGLAFSPDGAQLAVASASTDILLLDSWTGERHTLTGTGRNLYVVAWSADGRSLAAGSGGGQVVLWRDLEGEPVLLEGHSDIVSALAFDRTGQRLLSGSFDGTARLWELGAAVESRAFEGHEGPITALAWNPWEASFATASADQTVRTWDLGSTAAGVTLQGHEGEVTGLAWLEGGGVLVSAGHDGSLRSWDPVSGDLLALREDPSAQYMILAATRDGELLAAGDDQGRLHLWSPPSAPHARVLEGDGAMIFGLALDRGGTRVASGGVSRAASLWNTAAAGRAPATPGHEEPVTAVEPFPDGQRFASAGWDGQVRIWDRDGAQVAAWQAHDDSIEALRVAPDGEAVATGAADRSVRIHDATTGRLLQLLSGHYGTVLDLAFSPDGAWLASAGDAGMVYLWELATGRRETLLDQRSPTTVAIGPAGRQVAFAWTEGEQGRLRVQGLPTGALALDVTIEGMELAQLDFGADGSWLSAVARDGRVMVWELASGQASSPARLRGRGRAVAAQPSGRWVAAGSTHPELELVNLDDRSVLQLHGHRQTVEGLAFDPSGELLVSAGFDGTVRTWDVATGRPHWRGTALLPALDLRLDHRGWQALDGGERAPPQADWAQVVEERAVRAVEASDGLLVCIETRDGMVQAWDTTSDSVIEVGMASAFGYERLTPEWCVSIAHGSPPAVGPSLAGHELWDLPTSTEQVVIDGPLLTVAAGFTDGTVGLWDSRSGSRLLTRRLHGAVEHLAFRDGRLHAMSELGAATTIDLGVLEQPRCALLREVRTRVPVCWEGGAEPCEPPADDPCGGPDD